jgi:hypothetical protein
VCELNLKAGVLVLDGELDGDSAPLTVPRCVGP